MRHQPCRIDVIRWLARASTLEHEAHLIVARGVELRRDDLKPRGIGLVDVGFRYESFAVETAISRAAPETPDALENTKLPVR